MNLRKHTHQFNAPYNLTMYTHPFSARNMLRSRSHILPRLADQQLVKRSVVCEHKKRLDVRYTHRVDMSLREFDGVCCAAHAVAPSRGSRSPHGAEVRQHHPQAHGGSDADADQLRAPQRVA